MEESCLKDQTYYPNTKALSERTVMYMKIIQREREMRGRDGQTEGEGEREVKTYKTS